MYTSLIPNGIPSNKPISCPFSILASTFLAEAKAESSNKEFTELCVFCFNKFNFSCTKLIQDISLFTSC